MRQYTNFLLADSCVKLTKKRRVNKLWVFDWPRHAKINSYSEYFWKKNAYKVQFSANQSFTRNFFVTFIHESANRKIVYSIGYFFLLIKTKRLFHLPSGNVSSTDFNVVCREVALSNWKFKCLYRMDWNSMMSGSRSIIS